MHETDPVKARAYLRSATSKTAEILGDVRETVAILHDDAQRTPSFRLLLDRLRSDFSATHEMSVSWNVRVANEPSGRVAMAIYRVLQEALTNVARHAKASRIGVEVQGYDNWIEIRIDDDGRGFSGGSVDGHGLLSMRSRIESAGGTFRVSSEPAAGTQIVARVPLEAAT
jgi:signal transduction histidine kinase